MIAETASEDLYAKCARQATAEGLPRGKHDWWDRIRELVHEAGYICHSEVHSSTADFVIVKH